MKGEVRSRIRGCLLGGAVGDALGAPVERASLAEIRRRFGPQGVRDLAPAYGRAGAITDDTQMTLFTAEGLILAAQGASPVPSRSELVRIVHRAYLRWLLTQGERSRHPTFGRTSEGWLLGVAGLHQRRGPGRTCLAALRSRHMGRPEQPLNTSKGCGGLMRVAPVGLALRIDDSFGVGCDIAALTHGHPSGYLAAGFLALVIRELVLGGQLETAIREAREELERRPGHEECADAVEAALRLAEQGSPDPEKLESLGAGWVAEEALAIALYCALVSSELPAGLRLAVNHGGDSDSTGAIAGNLLGARLGEGAVPRRWLEVLELGPEIERIADELCEALAAPGLGSRF